PGGRGLKQRLQAVSFNAKAAAENVGAGYQTLAEAFSGWRNSPSHNKNMLLASATKIGIATAYAPKSKYQVYWALVLAEPDER
ncbi:MAG TPA: CAP domain-containing protein, partial [Xanthobacteraceae bacterium]|nr:CAP domain-containing protein [Xanthobacteraceae bacterium]